MNEVFTIVKIINFEYRFLLNNKNNAICKVDAILENGSIIKLIAYDNLADRLLRKLEINESEMNVRIWLLIYLYY